ncbi:MAG: lactate utilization protein [Clostridia bacterium]|nr:lactate utilization protein [Clostridia bacterium]
MDQHLKQVEDQHVAKVIENLKKRKMNGYYIQSVSELNTLLDELVKDDQVVSVGGSMSLFELNVIDYLRNRNVNFLDRYAPGLSSDDINEIYFKAFNADVYFASTNAITFDGELYNVDGRGNRVAAMIYGPKKVVLITGINKIVKDLEAAKERNRKIAAPANVQRLNKKTPCHTTGYCTDCQSPDKICHAHTIISSQIDPNRMHVIFVSGNFGY